MPTTRDNGHGLHFLLMGALVGMLGGILMMLFVMLATATYLASRPEKLYREPRIQPGSGPGLR